MESETTFKIGPVEFEGWKASAATAVFFAAIFLAGYVLGRLT